MNSFKNTTVPSCPTHVAILWYVKSNELPEIATPHRKSSRANFFLIFSVYISRTERGFLTKVCALSYHTQKHKFGALCPWTSKLNASKHRDSHSVGHVESAIFHCNIAMQQGHVENCGSLHSYFHQEQKKFWEPRTIR